MKRKYWLAAWVILLAALPGFAQQPIQFTIKKTIPLPADCFVQGFLVHDHRFYLSCGLYEKSRLLQIDRKGKVVREKTLPADIFAEGISLAGNHLYLLTWTNNKTLVFDAATFRQRQSLSYSGEGWGITFLPGNVSPRVITSNGSHQLTFRLPGNLEAESTQDVYLATGKPLDKLNELERVGDLLFANIWYATQILVLDARARGKTQPLAFLQFDFKADDPAKVLNGIAYDPDTDCLWLTGKNWGKAYALAVDLPEALASRAGVKIACNL